MKIDQMLKIGVKLVGLITLVYSFIKLVHGFTSLFVALTTTEVAQELIFAQRFVGFLGMVFPLVLGLIGYYLMNSGNKLADKIMASSPFDHDVQSLRSEIYIPSTQLVQSVGASIIPGLIYIVAGAYFMFNGKWIKEVAFPTERMNDINS